MATNGIVDVVEALSAGVVFLEPGALNALADLHSQLQQVGVWASETEKPRTSTAVDSALQLIERIILEECENPERSLEVVAETVGTLQRVARDGVDDAQLVYPSELGVSSAGGAASSALTSPVGSRASGAFTVTLPPYVDEAIFAEFLARQDTVLEEMETALLSLEHGPNDAEQRTLARHLHTLKGETALLGLNDIEQLCHTAEDLLDRGSPGEVVERLLNLKDWLKQAFEAYAGKGGHPPSVDEMLAVLRGTRESGGLSPAFETPPIAPSPERGGVGSFVAAPTPVPAPRPLTVSEDRALTGDRELIADFVVEAGEHLELSDIQLLTLEVDPDNQPAIDAVFRAFHTIKGVCGFIDLHEMQALAHESENLLDQARKGQIVLQGPYLDIVFDAIDMLKRLLGHIREALENNAPLQVCAELPDLIRAISDLASGRAVTTWHHGASESRSAAELRDPALLSGLRAEGESPPLGEILVRAGVVSPETLEEALALQVNSTPATPRNGNASAGVPPRAPLGEVLVKNAGVEAREVALALRAQKSTRQGEDVADVDPGNQPGALPSESPSPPSAGDSGGISVRETVKVDAFRLDQLVDMIGELVIAESMVCQSRDLVNSLTTELSRHVSQLDKITRELQEMAMGLRMVPVRSTFQKMARLVRDVAKKTGKEVNFVMQGEDTELDKTVVDRISDPLVHMIRNAVDHGLESSGEERRAAGKPTTGTVWLRAYHSGGSIQIEIADDGKGLDREAILAKARERGLISDSGESMSSRDVWQLIFEPGFSTAKQLTEVSGRGVGMDVVKRNIEELRGEIDIHSELGQGSRFTIRLPLTLAIIDGMVIRTGTERFIIPTLSIVVSVRPRPGDLGTVVGSAETMRLQGEIIPLFRLYELFDLPGARTAPTEATVVVLENAGKRVGLLIDEILGQQQIVIKSLGPSLKGAKGIAGGAIMPDGKVGLIIDIGELLKLATDGLPA